MAKFPPLLPALVALAISVGATRSSAGATQPPPVIVHRFAGDDGALRAAVVRALRLHGFAVLDDSVPGAGSATDAIAVDGRVRRRGWKYLLTVQARGAAAQPPIARATFAGAPRAIARDMARHLDRRLGRALRHLRSASGAQADARIEPLGPPSSEAPPAATAIAGSDEDAPLDPHAPPAVGDDHDDDGEPNGPRPRPEMELRQPSERGGAVGQTLDFALGVTIFTRHFYYRDPVGTLTPYRLLWAPAPMGNVDWFLLEYVGLTATGQIETGATTTDRDGIAYPTAHYAAMGGLKLRVPVASAWISVAAEYGLDVFRIDDASPDTPKPPVPSVDYRFARGELALLLRPTSYLTVRLAGGYRRVFAAGEVESTIYFPHASVRGFDGSVTLGVRLRRGLELRVAADARRYELALQSQPGDLRMAGGATDDFVGGTISLAVLVGGQRGF